MVKVDSATTTKAMIQSYMSMFNNSQIWVHVIFLKV